jgi:hypothetical protein
MSLTTFDNTTQFAIDIVAYGSVINDVDDLASITHDVQLALTNVGYTVPTGITTYDMLRKHFIQSLSTTDNVDRSVHTLEDLLIDVHSTADSHAQCDGTIKLLNVANDTLAQQHVERLKRVDDTYKQKLEDMGKETQKYVDMNSTLKTAMVVLTTEKTTISNALDVANTTIAELQQKNADLTAAAIVLIDRPPLDDLDAWVTLYQKLVDSGKYSNLTNIADSVLRGRKVSGIILALNAGNVPLKAAPAVAAPAVVAAPPFTSPMPTDQLTAPAPASATVTDPASATAPGHACPAMDADDDAWIVFYKKMVIEFKGNTITVVKELSNAHLGGSSGTDLCNILQAAGVQLAFPKAK